jgi:hypothetical protein
MCKASKYLSEIDIIVNNIKNDLKKLNNKQSEYDKEISNLYHEIETVKFNACEGFYYTKRLQELLQKRRLVKVELYRMKMIHDTLHINDMNNRLPKAQSSVQKSKDSSREWLNKFNITFSDIEAEVLH